VRARYVCVGVFSYHEYEGHIRVFSACVCVYLYVCLRARVWVCMRSKDLKRELFFLGLSGAILTLC